MSFFSRGHGCLPHHVHLRLGSAHLELLAEGLSSSLDILLLRLCPRPVALMGRRPRTPLASFHGRRCFRYAGCVWEALGALEGDGA